MQWKEIELSSQDLFRKALNNNQSQASEMSFANMFMWRKNYNFVYSVINNMLCLVSNSRMTRPFAFFPVPLGEFEPEAFQGTIGEIVKYFDINGWKLAFGRVEESRIPLLQQHLGVKFEANKNEANSDYIYETDSLVTLAGKKLSAKRNHINKFTREYGSFEYVELTSELVEECKRIFDGWCQNNEACDCQVPEECEKWACYQLLDNWDAITGLKGALIKVNGRFEAFTIGEMLNADTAVIHIEKGNTEIHGIYTLINREFVARTFPETKYINREEDMGKEGLRKAKSSYYPSGFVHKYDIFPEF
ncbi:MAG: DUF2156 domain-containing protein [Thermoclostridium sp.]|nr:DUF2156 domain-containing protein [Thermoclostridium sp.]